MTSLMNCADQSGFFVGYVLCKIRKVEFTMQRSSVPTLLICTHKITGHCFYDDVAKTGEGGEGMTGHSLICMDKNIGAVKKTWHSWHNRAATDVERPFIVSILQENAILVSEFINQRPLALFVHLIYFHFFCLDFSDEAIDCMQMMRRKTKFNCKTLTTPILKNLHDFKIIRICEVGASKSLEVEKKVLTYCLTFKFKCPYWPVRDWLIWNFFKLKSFLDIVDQLVASTPFPYSLPLLKNNTKDLSKVSRKLYKEWRQKEGIQLGSRMVEMEERSPSESPKNYLFRQLQLMVHPITKTAKNHPYHVFLIFFFNFSYHYLKRGKVNRCVCLKTVEFPPPSNQDVTTSKRKSSFAYDKYIRFAQIFLVNHIGLTNMTGFWPKFFWPLKNINNRLLSFINFLIHKPIHYFIHFVIIYKMATFGKVSKYLFKICTFEQVSTYESSTAFTNSTTEKPFKSNGGHKQLEAGISKIHLREISILFILSAGYFTSKYVGRFSRNNSMNRLQSFLHII
ncbi:hypothetical protein EGR_04930 [Echinococcus granulosus]|uniref:Uncharacterized protein n=1 Tax=Echinococcus granulosus TaxID=6210 RepID=W6UFL0_ECHGR|nr:hypothetical protein EGR_04930 [Echinococcus granulosus]EUB60220.1 hypothetical protein EGR_04930 [Echinococcus granulosus]